MAYEDTHCPCGGKKPTDTMLCDACEDHLKDRREMKEYQDITLRVDYRRSAAVILVSLARRRKNTFALVASVLLLLAFIPPSPASIPHPVQTDLIATERGKEQWTWSDYKGVRKLTIRVKGKVIRVFVFELPKLN